MTLKPTASFWHFLLVSSVFLTSKATWVFVQFTNSLNNSRHSCYLTFSLSPYLSLHTFIRGNVMSYNNKNNSSKWWNTAFFRLLHSSCSSAIIPFQFLSSISCNSQHQIHENTVLFPIFPRPLTDLILFLIWLQPMVNDIPYRPIHCLLQISDMFEIFIFPIIINCKVSLIAFISKYSKRERKFFDDTSKYPTNSLSEHGLNCFIRILMLLNNNLI